MDSVVELLPRDRLYFPSQGEQLEGYDQSEVPVVSSTSSMASAGLVEGLIPVSNGVPLACHSMVSQREKIQPPPHRSVAAIPGFASGSGLTIENAGGNIGITWSSVVEKNTHGGVGMAADGSWLLGSFCICVDMPMLMANAILKR